jgi:O-antigen/teichoic acid export membrane protein
VSNLKSIARNSAWLTLAMMFGRSAVVLSGILIARFFGAEAFALFAFVHITATSVSNIAILGLMNCLLRFIARMQLDPLVATLSRALVATGASPSDPRCRL